MLQMAKKQQIYQFLFSTTDLDFDPSTVSVVDSKTGKFVFSVLPFVTYVIPL